MNNPYLIFENIARVKRLVDSIQYSGPVAVAGDCTKVRARLSYSTDFGAHILGSVWELKDCIAEDPEDIERVIDKITAAKAQATQVRAILIKVDHPPNFGRRQLNCSFRFLSHTYLLWSLLFFQLTEKTTH